MCFPRILVRGVVLLAGLVVIAALLYLRYHPLPPASPCTDIPEGAVLLAPAFWNLGRNPAGKYVPGGANEDIAQAVERCADRLALVLTQRAVSDADVLQNASHLRNGVPVEQMHRDDTSYGVGTLEALRCALDRLDASPDYRGRPIALLAHPRHVARSRRALEAVMGDNRRPIVVVHLGSESWPTSDWRWPWKWAACEVFKWPAQAAQARRSVQCSDEARIATPLPPPAR